MDEERTGRTRLKVAGIAAAALLAVPGGIAISSAVASDGGAGSASSTAAPYAPVQDQDRTPPQDGERRDRGDCPGKDGNERGGEESGTSATGTTWQ